MAIEKEDLFKEGPSKEELAYKHAVELMEAIECVERFERAVKSLRSAAHKFEALGDYEDSIARREGCLALAEELEKKGKEDTLKKGKEMLEKASTKRDFVFAMEEFRRLKKYDDTNEEALKYIAICKKGILKLENKAARIRWAIALVIIAILGGVSTKTPVYPIAKGMVHGILGQNQAAINCYSQAEAFPGVSKLSRGCYYKLAQEAEKGKNREKTLEYYRLAWASKDAMEKTVELEREILSEAKVGDIVSFGGIKWSVLEKKKGVCKLLMASKGHMLAYSNTDGSWDDSTIKKWLNGSFLSAHFSDYEIIVMGGKIKNLRSSKKSLKNLIKKYEKKAVEDPVDILRASDYIAYKEQNILPDYERTWWTKTVGASFGVMQCVRGQDGELEAHSVGNTKVSARPVISVMCGEK